MSRRQIKVAEQVMRMAGSAASVLDDEDETKKFLMRKQSGEPRSHVATDTPSAPPIVHTVLNSGGGQPLDTMTRAFMEPRFGHDFSQVRVHTDGQAAESARSVNALAYTVGRDVVFGTGEYAPTTAEGKRLLARELVHVIQQTSSAWMRHPELKNARKKIGPEPEVQREEDDKPDAGKVEPPKETTPEEEKKEAKGVMTNCRKNYWVESWEADTCCLNHGFPDPSAKNKKPGADCCNTFPEFVDNEAIRRGFDGAASCRKQDFLNHRARVTPGPGGKSTVEVLCVDTRRRKEARVIELGYKAAQKAYGSIHVLDKKATVCIGDKEEAKTCYLETDCDNTIAPKESQCIPASCSKTDAAGTTEKQDKPKK